MNPDEKNGGVPPTNEDIIEVPEGQADPLDAITDVEELRKAAKANRAIGIRYKKKATTPVAPTTPPVTPIKVEVPTNTPQDKSYSREELNLRIDGWTDDEVAFIVRNGGSKELANSNSAVAIAMKTKREQREAEVAASRTGSGQGGSGTVETKYTQEQLSHMSIKELEAILPHAPQQ